MLKTAASGHAAARTTGPPDKVADGGQREPDETATETRTKTKTVDDSDELCRWTLGTARSGMS